MSEIPFLPPAEEEFLEAIARYEAARAGLGGEFLAEVERAARRIAFFPLHGSPYLVGTRRIVLRRFPYSVVYKPDPDDLLVIAVAHQRRKPGYWAERVPANKTRRVGADDLLRFAASIEGRPLVTRARGAEFRIRAVSAGLEVIPTSTESARLISPPIIDRFCEQYDRTGSTRPVDYQDVTFDASYLLALMDAYSRPGPRK